MDQEETRTCEHCAEHLPISEFRPVRKGSHLRRRECRSCYNSRQQAYRAQKRLKALVNYTWNVGSRLEDQRVISVTSEMVRRYGGLHKFCEAWWTSIAQEGQKSRLATYSLVAVSRLIGVSNDLLAKEQPVLDDLSDEELNAHWSQAVSDEARKILRELGYDVDGEGTCTS